LDVFVNENIYKNQSKILSQSYLFVVSKDADSGTGCDDCPSHELSKGGLVLSEEIVDDDTPISDTFRSHLKEIRFEKQLERFLPPRFPRVLITAERCHQRTAGSETWYISDTEIKRN
jgi:hypothetical protein